ncbi:MAG TPA: GBS Bsp-like repeat-containing protein [Candidatus Mediterraneibacter guildfordensis]|jgi:phosphoglycerol transferase|nr:GBS Bsp-like repeat-containing protein [Candidatus Mediterraneibacter guildfordensis]
MSKVSNVLCKFLFGFGNVLMVLFAALTILAGASTLWVLKTWPHLTMQELMFTIQSPVEGTNKEMILDYIVFCIPVTVIVMAALIAGLVITRMKKGYRIMAAAVPAVSVILLAGTVYTAWERLDIADYAANSGAVSSFIDENYVDPAGTELTFPEQKRNLIYIFLESMETTYADEENGGAFSENYIPELTELAEENEDFSGADAGLNGGTALTSTTWTAAALFGQTTGLPLSIPIDGNSMDTQESFLPGVTSLGDILEQQGYRQTFMIGSDGNFGGRSLYFTDHGNYDIKDYYYYQSQGKFDKDYWVWWGFEDQKLFEYAKEELTALAAQDQPFNFTLLTVDTHFEDGYVCGLCGNEHGENQYGNVLSCSSRQIKEFVEWIRQQDFYENTTIVISGDHPTMDKDFCEGIDDAYERKVYTAYINSAVTPEDPEWTRAYSTFDNYPTTLASLGVSIEGERLGLGTNLFSSRSTLTEVYGNPYINQELTRKSELMDQLTEEIDIDNMELKIREGRVPTVTATALPYDFRTGVLQVVIDNIQNADDGIAGITVAVWTGPDQSNLQWLQAEAQPDGSYIANVNIPGFGFATGEYYIDVYLTDNMGNQNLAGSTVGYVE